MGDTHQLTEMFGLRIALVFLLITAACQAAKDKCAKGTTSKCSKLGGVCQSSKEKCSGEEYEGKKYCTDSKKCVCCVEMAPTTPEPTTTAVPTTTTTPVPTTTTTPVPSTTTTPLPSSSPWPSSTPSSPWPSTPSWPTGPGPTGPGPLGEGCYNPAGGDNLPIRAEITGPCDTYVCTAYGWVYLVKANETCCSLKLKEDDEEVSYPTGSMLTIEPTWESIMCDNGIWISLMEP